MLLRNIHAYYGEFLQLVPIAVLIWALFSRKGSFQRLAPVALYNTEAELEGTVRIIRELLDTKAYLAFEDRAGAVT